MEHQLNTGYDLVSDLLRRNQYDLTAILREACYQENMWLEFKADPFFRKEYAENTEKQDDFSWHILRAVMAFANTCGGCILIGMDDSGRNAVDLRDKDTGEICGPSDKFIRDLHAVLLEKKQFSLQNENPKNPNRETVTFNTAVLQDLISFEYKVHFQGKQLLAVLVKESVEPVFAKRNEKDLFLVRDKTGTALVNSLSMPDAFLYMRKRPEISRLANYFSNIPTPNETFVGRVKELEELDSLLSEIPRKIPVIHAPAGMGKTELAFRYAEVFREKYEACIYIRSEGVKNIPSGLKQILLDGALKKQLGIEIPPDALDEVSLFQVIRNALMAPQRKELLILFDNLDSPAILHPAEIARYLSGPGEEKLHIYATTRSDTLRVNGNDSIVPYELSGLSTDDGLELLKKKHPVRLPEEEAAALEIVDYLCGNAWALDLIGEELKQRRHQKDDDYRNVLQRIRQEPVLALQKAGEKETVRIKHGCLDPVQLLAPTLQRLGTVAREFADTASICHPDLIFSGWLKGVYERKHQKMLEEDIFENAMDELDDFHILIRKKAVFHAGKGSFEICKIHRLTRSVLHCMMGDHFRREYIFFRKYFLRELLNLLGERNADAAKICKSTVSVGSILPSWTSVLGSVLPSWTSVKDRENDVPESDVPGTIRDILLFGLPYLLEDSGKNKESENHTAATAIGSAATTVLGTVTAAANLATGGAAVVGGLLTAAAFGPLNLFVGAAETYLQHRKRKTGEEESAGTVLKTNNSNQKTCAYAAKVKENIMPSMEWVIAVDWFMKTFQEIKEDLDEEDRACVEEFFNRCREKLSSLPHVSSLHDAQLEDKAAVLLFDLHSIVTEIIPDPARWHEYLETLSVFYNYLIGFWKNAPDKTEKLRLEAVLRSYIERAKTWKKEQFKELEEIILENPNYTLRRLSHITFPNPVFLED